jgi:simple sugar transport system ATP-binding protein
VVGLAGLLGSGRTELARLLFGADHADTGESVRRSGARLRSPRAAIARRHRVLREDRKAEGIVGDLTVRDNIVLALQAARGWSRRIPQARATSWSSSTRGARHPPPTRRPDAQPVGGNQQKVLLARWLITDPSCCILDEPTRGIDVGAKAQIQKLVAELAARAWRWSSSPPSSRRCCGSADRSRCCATAARSTSCPTTTSAHVCEIIAATIAQEEADRA